MPLILKNWQLILIAMLLAATSVAGYYVILLKAQKDTLVAEKNTLVAELGVSQASVKSLSLAVKDQNLAIEKLKTDADNRLSMSAKEVARARANAESANRTAAELLKKQVPQGATQCDAASNLFNEEIRRAKE